MKILDFSLPESEDLYVNIDTLLPPLSNVLL